jgi:DNA-binding response OmpR family regulator
MALATQKCRDESVPDGVHPVAIRRHTEVVMAPAARRSTGVTIDTTTREATVRGHAVALTHQEFDLLRVLMSGPDFVWSREHLIESAWTHDSYVTAATVDAVITALRRKIERDAHAPELILDAGGVGYRLVDVE